MAVLSDGDKRLGAVLLDGGFVKDTTLSQAIVQQQQAGGRLGDILIHMGALSEHHLARILEQNLGIPLVNLTQADVMTEALAKISGDAAYKLMAFPFAISGTRLRVALYDPLDFLTVEALEDQTGCAIEAYKVLADDLHWALATYYPELGLSAPTNMQAESMQRFGEMALQKGFITKKQLNYALQEQERTGGMLGRILSDLGFLSSPQVSQLLAEQYELIYAEDLSDAENSGPLRDTLLRVDALQLSAAPYKMQGNAAVIAVSDPRHIKELQAIIQDIDLIFICAPEAEIRRVIDELYAGEEKRLGEVLLKDNKIKREHLREALNNQRRTGKSKPIGEILSELGYITSMDLQAALEQQRSGEGRLEDTLVQSGKISADDLARSLAGQLGYDFIEADSVEIDPNAILLVPEETVRRYNIMPIRLDNDRTLVVAMKDPRHVFALDDLQLLTRKEIVPAVATEETLDSLINRYYKGDDLDELTEGLAEEFGGDFGDEDIDDSSLDDSRLVQLVNNIIRESVIADISDIHIEPNQDNVMVRVRKDGALKEYGKPLPKSIAAALIARIKIMGGLDIAEKRIPQDGRIRYRDKTMTIDMRLSTLPTVYGEKAVARILKKADNIPEIEQLGFADYNLQRFKDVIHKPYGMFLITGPTGSGKSFTTFSILKRLARPEVNVTTVEDPVEYEVPSINQTQINNKAGLSFPAALRAFLRQDPDIIMVGEIRDSETANISVEAALTGHLLIATLHTNDATGAITRLEEMGVELFNISSSLLGVVAQRLVRRVCKDCQTEYTPDPDIVRRLGLEPSMLEGRSLVRGTGCDKCAGTGYRGRMAIHELLSMDREVQKAVVKGLSANEIKEVAEETGMVTLRNDGINKALAGYTTLEEVLSKTAN